MAWLPENRKEREQHVIELYKQGKTVREIAQLTHMSFRDIGAIKNKWIKQTQQGQDQLEEIDDYDIKSKSKITQAMKLFSEGKASTEVVIALDLPADQVRAIYREYCELKGMHELAEVYEEIKPYLSSILMLHKILKDLGMGEQEIIKVLGLAKHNQLEHLQGKTEYLQNEIEMLEAQKTKVTNHILNLNAITNGLQETINNNSRYSQPYTSSYSIDISYSPMDEYLTNG